MIKRDDIVEAIAENRAQTWEQAEQEFAQYERSISLERDGTRIKVPIPGNEVPLIIEGVRFRNKATRQEFTIVSQSRGPEGPKIYYIDKFGVMACLRWAEFHDGRHENIE